MSATIEADYPITFRSDDAATLGNHLKHHESVVIIGMKRVGISNFLRFFLSHNDISTTYIKNGTNLFVPVDLNNLVERDITPFWTLTLKRLVDTIDESSLPDRVKNKAQKAFADSIQLQDPFITLDSVQKVIRSVVEHDVYPTLFLLRFDRLADAVTPAFFDNLQAVKDAARRSMSYVFTSYRPLHELCPKVFTKSSLTVFSKDMYIKPAKDDDMRSIMHTLLARYDFSLDENTSETLLSLAAGHVQYLHLAIMRLKEMKKSSKATQPKLLQTLVKDEQITLVSEELYESLNKKEQDILNSVHKKKKGTREEKERARYLWDTGMIQEANKTSHIFSPLLDEYLTKQSAPKSSGQDFTKKEHLLFECLKEAEGQLVERDAIIEAVWPEQAELGVSDWAIDRLVARVRAKLKKLGNEYEIITIVTRGYKLISHR